MSQGRGVQTAAKVSAAVAIAAMLAAACSAATPTPTPTPSALLVLVSDEALSSALTLRRGYLAASRATVNIEIRPASENEVATRLGEHSADLALAFGEPDPQLWAAPLALLPLRVVVHESNPVGEIREDDLRSLFAGAIVNWRALGGPDAVVAIIAQDSQSEASRVFAGEVLGGGTIGGSARIAPAGWAVAQAVGQEPAAIGYLACPQVTSRVHPVAIIDPSSGSPIQAVLSLFAVAEVAPKGAALDFLLWAQSPAGRSAVSRGCAE
jgi:PBP superfamily domain